MKQAIFSLFLFSAMTMTLMAQHNPVLLFPDGAPGESRKLKQVDDLSGNKVAGCPVLRISNVSAPTLTFYPAPADNNSGATIIVNPGRIGVMGFSAGAHLSAMASTAYGERTYPKVDAYDEVSLRPDFCILIYPAYLSGENFSIAPELEVDANTPPTILVQTQDDKDYINSSLFYYYALKEAKVPAAMHLYPSGCHGYGLRNTGHTVNEWPHRVLSWLRDMNMVN